MLFRHGPNPIVLTPPQHILTAKTLTGLEEVLAAELKALGANEVSVQNRAVAFRGDTSLILRANLWSRTALSILREVGRFRFDSKESFYEQMRQLPWNTLFSAGKTMAVYAQAHRTEVFSNTLYLAQLTKDAMADAFRETTGRRPDVDTRDPQLRIQVYVLGDECAVSLDSSGDPLFRRGYRKAGGVAPMNEVLAAGLISLSGWDGQSPFLDPMCGSATFAVEAALMATNTAPGLLRKSYGFMHWPDYEPALFEQLKAEALDKRTPLRAVIQASDISGKALGDARRNILTAGFTGDIRVQRGDFFTHQPSAGPGWVMLNPPYDRRLGTRDLPGFYERIGNVLKRQYAGYHAGIISEARPGLRYVGLKPLKQVTVFNGPIECRFALYELFQGKHKAHVEQVRKKRPRLS